MKKDRTTHFYESPSSDYANLLHENREEFVQTAKRICIWIAVIGGLIVFVILLPMLINHVASIILACKNVKQAIKA